MKYLKIILVVFLLVLMGCNKNAVSKVNQLEKKMVKLHDEEMIFDYRHIDGAMTFNIYTKDLDYIVKDVISKNLNVTITNDDAMKAITGGGVDLYDSDNNKYSFAIFEVEGFRLGEVVQIALFASKKNKG